MSFFACCVGVNCIVRSMIVGKVLMYDVRRIADYIGGEKLENVIGFWEKYEFISIENGNPMLIEDFINNHDNCYYSFTRYSNDEMYYDIYCGDLETYEKLSTLHSLGYFDL